jgi:outer membrane lipase/esterase
MVGSLVAKLANRMKAAWVGVQQDDADLSVKRVGGAFVAMALVMGGLVAACGGTTTIESQFKPGRVIVFGDALSDLGQVQDRRYSVNDGSRTNWTEQVAVGYQLTVSAVVSGGLSYATGNARVLQKPDAAGSTTTLTVKEQIDRFLATDRFRDTDLVLMSAGLSDLIALYRAGGATAATTAAGQQAARDYADQIKRVVAAGGKYVFAIGAYDLGLTPWGQASGNAAYLSELVRLFEERLVVDIVGMGNNVLFVDGKLYFTPMFVSPGSFGLGNSVTPACTSVDPGNGIGTGVGLVSSALCTTATLAQVTSTAVVTATVSPFTTTTATVTSSIAYNGLVFADGVYLTPFAQSAFGTYVYSRLANRW